ncbi:non-ribosomal peptide synthetase [Gordoniibacillus kamchatkensis]|uniref:non-ribosomal peptide synthetase n=1 Tax=Gordoniibacillus kamchatkensis TaxID=1590651 RepID=UPI000ACB10FD|nr:phosphopantetheine-binding protein [Paenibacillus sp. VKM B-2647]
MSLEPTLIKIDSQLLEENMVFQADIDGPSTELVSSGAVPPELELCIVDPVSKSPCPPHRVGEIWINGPGNAAGYWNDAPGTQETFLNELDGKGAYMRTGDLGFIWDGHLFITGRIKDLIILNGKNVYPTDLEETAGTSHEAVRPGKCAAFSVDLGKGEAIVLVCELERTFLRKGNMKQIAETIRRNVQTTHELSLHDVILVKPVSLPKTSSGKIQRFLCKEQYMTGTLDTVFAWSNEYETAREEPDRAVVVNAAAETVEAQLVKNMIVLHVARELKLDAGQVSIDEPLTGMGIDSLKMMSMATEQEEQLKLTLTPDLFYDYPTIRSLSGKIGVMLLDQQAGPQAPSDSAEPAIPDENYRIEYFPEYRALKEQLNGLSLSRVKNPYFMVHDVIRTGTTRVSERELISFSSYNYLGLSGHPSVSEKAKATIDRFGTSVSASRIASGEKPFHRRLEQAIAI